MEKQKRLTPKELLQQKKNLRKVAELRKLAKGINEALKNSSVDEAEQKLSILAVEIDNQFSQKKLQTKVSDLKLKTKDSEVTALLKLVEGLNVTEAVQMLYGFENMIKGKIKHNMQKVTIDELKIELL